MKRLTAIAIGIMVALTGMADPDTAITNYLSGYICVPSTFTNAGDTALSTNASQGYACIPISDLSYCTEAEASGTTTNSDIRALLFSLVMSLEDTLTALASTNQFTYMSISEALSTGSSADALLTHKIQTQIDLGTSTLPSE